MIAALGGFVYLWQAEASKSKESNKKVLALENDAASKDSKISELSKELEERKETTGEANIKKDQYQAVFLKSGSVYFGIITKISDNQITLTDIYYLRDEDTENISLTKLGNELHGPEDIMYIERKEVEFWENLKPDGQVAKAITEYVKAQQ